MNTYEKGNVAEAAVLAAFVKRGWTVLVPFGGACRYDLVVDRGKGLERVQVKSVKTRAGALQIPTCSVQPDRKTSRAYTEAEIDLLAAWWPEGGRLFLVPASELLTRQISLRLTPAANGQEVGIRHAADYELPA